MITIENDQIDLSHDKIPFLNMADEKMISVWYDNSHPQKFIYPIWNILIHQSKYFNHRILSILSQVVIVLLLGFVVSSYSNGNPSKKQILPNLLEIKYFEGAKHSLDSYDEKISGHLGNCRNQESMHQFITMKFQLRLRPTLDINM